MTDLFAEEVGVEDFALPDDADKIALKNAKLAEAEATPAEEPAVEETAPATEEAPAEGETPAEETTATEEAPAAEKLYAGKYKSTEELEAAYLEAQKLIPESADWRREMAALREEIAAQQAATPPAPPVQITADLIETNPAYAAQLAYEQDNGVAFSMAFEQWRADDPFAAAAWANGKQTEAQIAELQAKYEERLNAVQSKLEPVARTTDAATLNSLIAHAETQTPGLTEFVLSDKVAVVAQEFPEEADALLNGTPDQKARSLQKLFLIDGGRNRDTLQATTEQVGRATAEEAQKVREESFVASATTATSGVKPSKADEIAAEWDALEAPYKDGWNI